LKLRRWHILVSSLILVFAVVLTLGVGMVHTPSTHAAGYRSPIEVNSNAQIILHYGAGYHYKVVQTGADQGFQDPGYNASSFQAGKAAFGTGNGCPLDSTIHTPWSPNTDILVRKTLFLPAGTTGLTVHLAIDNDAVVYWNGVQIGSIVHDGCAAHDTLIAPVPDSAVRVGKNLLAIRGTDRGGETYLDLQVRQG
jgi:hypothetical protein